MTAPNRNALWGEVLVGELAAAGLSGVCLVPGSRSTPLVTAVVDHPDLETFSHLDERSAAFFALGRGRRSGRPTAVICTSGTAAANLHPAVVEADEGRVPLVVVTADRPPERHDSGANQTIDQDRLYGEAPRWSRTLPEPAVAPRTLRSVRVTAARAVAAATGPHPGPVHLNVPFHKPLAPTEQSADRPAGLADQSQRGAEGRDGPFVTMRTGRPTIGEDDIQAIAGHLDAADRGLVVCGPATVGGPSPDSIAEFATATGFPVLADPLSGLRFGPHVADVPIVAGYDSYLDAAVEWPAPAVVVRFGASPTSKVCRHYLRDADTTQILVDPAGGWPEAEYTAAERVVADPTWLATALAETVSEPGLPTWRERFETAERQYWELVEAASRDRFFEGAILFEVAARCPDPSTLFVSNSMPVRDLDRFGQPREAAITALGNRGASGIDGIVSTGLGAGSATDDPLVVVLGDLAYYHDMNGLLAIGRCDVDATIVIVDNDGGGIFHKLPIEDVDPPFTEWFKTPHGLDFSPTADLYDLEFVETADRSSFVDAVSASLSSPGTQVVAASVDAAASHRYRESLHARVCREL